MDFHRKATNYLVTASDDESIRLYDVQNAVWVCAITLCSMVRYSCKLYWFTSWDYDTKKSVNHNFEKVDF